MKESSFQVRLFHKKETKYRHSDALTILIQDSTGETSIEMETYPDDAQKLNIRRLEPDQHRLLDTIRRVMDKRDGPEYVMPKLAIYGKGGYENGRLVCWISPDGRHDRWTTSWSDFFTKVGWTPDGYKDRGDNDNLHDTPQEALEDMKREFAQYQEYREQCPDIAQPPGCSQTPSAKYEFTALATVKIYENKDRPKSESPLGMEARLFFDVERKDGPKPLYLTINAESTTISVKSPQREAQKSKNPSQEDPKKQRNQER